MHINLSPDQAKFVQEQLTNGYYDDANELISAALRLLEQEKQLENLRQKIAVGTKQIQQGQVVEGETVFQELSERINQMPPRA